MDHKNKSKEQLIEEIRILRERVHILEGGIADAADAHVSLEKIVKDTGVLSDLSPEQRKLFTMFSVEKAADEVFWMRSDSKILYVNESACKRLGYTHHEMLEMYVWDWDPLFPESTWKTFYEELCDKKTLNIETKHQTKGGEIFPVEISSHICRYGGEHYVFAFVKDITERKHADAEKAMMEAQLRQVQKMEAIGVLAGGVAHDFNNMLGVILGSAEMAKLCPSKEGSHKYLDQVFRAANRAKGLVNQILAFSRQSQVETIPMKLQPVIKEGMKMLRSTIPSTVSIIEDIEPDCGTVMADPTQVHQILMNLCTNAYHSMKDSGGTLRLQLKKTVFSTDQAEKKNSLPGGEYVELVVRDSGVGIGPDLITKVFDPYFTTKQVGEGTGLGLAIVHGIMKEYGGTIEVESTLGEGTTFRAYFPVVIETAIEEFQEAGHVEKGSERVLLVDDEAILAETAKIMLEWLGYDVTLCCDSNLAFATFQKAPDSFDLVLTDQTMPDLTGAELSRKIRNIRTDIPIILCTGYSNLIDEHSAKALGINEFVLKPLTLSVLSKVIRKVLNGV